MKSSAFPVFKLYEFNISKMFLFTSSTLALSSFLVIQTFRMAWRNDLKLLFFIGAWNDIFLQINLFCRKFLILFFPTPTTLSILYAISPSRVTPELIFTNFSLLTWIPNGFSYSCSMTSVTCNSFSSDVLICFGHIGLYSVAESSIPVSLWSSWIDVAVSGLSRKQFLRNMVL